MLFTTLVVLFLVCCMLEVEPANRTAPNLRHTTNQERHDQCGKQHHSREFLMMGIIMLETC